MPRIRSNVFRQSRSLMVYSPSSGNVCRTRMPPRVPGGRPSTCWSCDRSGRTRYTAVPGAMLRLPTARRLMFHDADRYRSISEGETRQDVRDVVEPAALIVGRQQRGRVDVERQQVPNGVGVFGPVQAMHGGPPGTWSSRPPRDPEPISRYPARPSSWARAGRGMPGGGIIPTRSFRIDFLPGLGAFRHVRQVGMFERQAARPARVVVTGDAVLVQDTGMRGTVGFNGTLLRRSCCPWPDPDSGDQNCQTRRQRPSTHRRPPEALETRQESVQRQYTLCPTAPSPR